MSSISEFLEARIAEDIEQAQRMLISTPTPDDSLENGWDFEWAERVMAESRAKGVIVSMHATYASESGQRSGVMALVPEIGRDVLFDAMRALAVVYKDHSGYQQEWSL